MKKMSRTNMKQVKGGRAAGVKTKWRCLASFGYVTVCHDKDPLLDDCVDPSRFCSNTGASCPMIECL
jgi:hypothetical protein